MASRAARGRRFLIMIILFFCLFSFVVLWLMFSIVSFWLFMRQANSLKLSLHLAVDSSNKMLICLIIGMHDASICCITILHSLSDHSVSFLVRELCKDTSKDVKTSREAFQASVESYGRN